MDLEESFDFFRKILTCKQPGQLPYVFTRHAGTARRQIVARGVNCVGHNVDK